MKKFLFFALLPLQLFAQKLTSNEANQLEKQAQQVEIIRDKWGIAHVYGKTDADAVFGFMYAQCEDDFKRVELNYIEKLGRLAELDGEKSLYSDLQIRLLIDTSQAISDYKNAEPWMKKLLNAYANGINYFMHKNPQVKPALLTKFKPWYPFLWTDGSIGAISAGNLTIDELKKFYTNDYSLTSSLAEIRDQHTGSNGFAFAPKITKSGNAILYINPHTTYYFRPEIQMQSEEGLNAYGAVTWGQFFVYQGFNEFCGWMHTSNNVDVADMYAEKITTINGKHYYTYNGKRYPVGKKRIDIKYVENGLTKTKNFETYYTRNGPVMAIRDGKWISLKHKNQNAASLVQSWVRTKSKSFAAYQKAMDLNANASNNTVYADAKGNIAYWHGNFIPKRNPAYNWSDVIDATTPATNWQGLHTVEESVHVYNPKNGWLQNCNSTPFSVAGANSPKKENYPPYMAPDGENFRGVAALRLLNQPKKYNLDDVIALGYDTYLPAFEVLVPALIAAYEQLPATDERRVALKEPIASLKTWNYYAAENSIATTLAMEWAPRLNKIIQKVYIDQGEDDQVANTKKFAKTASAKDLLEPLQLTIDDLNKRFGKWQMPWGEVNRFQRLTGGIVEKYDDKAVSLPVAFGSALWGQLPSYRSNTYNTNKRYGYSGNSFVCAVEFGPRIKAKSILAGGNSSDPNSKHFNDQAEMFTNGEFKDVLFYKEDVIKNAERRYQPGK